MKKLSKKAIFGIIAGVGAAVVGAGCILKKKSSNNDEYSDSEAPVADGDVNYEDVDPE